MSDIQKFRNIITEATKEQEHHLVEATEMLPSDDIYSYDNGMTYMFMYLESDGLDEGIAGTLGKLFKGAKQSMSDMKDGTTDAFKRRMKRLSSQYKSSMSKDMKKQVKEITKKLKDKYYFDLNLTLQSFEKKKALYSEPFFKELLDSFSLDPDVYREVWKEYGPQIRKLDKGIKSLYKEYASNNPEAKQKLPKASQAFHHLPKKLQRKVIDDANYLVGSIIGFTAAVSIANFFKKNPAKFKESNELVLESIDVNGVIKKQSVDSIMKDIEEQSHASIIEQLESMDDEDQRDTFNWDDDIEEEHDSIYKQYIEDNK